VPAATVSSDTKSEIQNMSQCAAFDDYYF